MGNALTYSDFFFPKEQPQKTSFHFIFEKTSDQTLHSEIITDIEKLLSQITSGKDIHMIFVYDLNQGKILKKIAAKFDIDYLNQQDILNKNHPTKIEFRENYFILITKVFAFQKNTTLTESQVSIVCHKNSILCFLDRNFALFENIEKEIEEYPNANSTEFLFSFLFKKITKNHENILETFLENLEYLEDKILSQNTYKNLNQHFRNSRKQYSLFKKNVPTLSQEFKKLELWKTQENLLPLFNDLQDHLKHNNQILETTKDSQDALTELYMSNMNLKLNEIIKRLTIISTIFIPLTFMAGIWGMNFKYMPELALSYGYPLALGTMALTGLLIYIYFKNSHW